MEMRAGRGRIKLCIHFLERFEDWVESDYCRVDSLNRKSGGAMKGEGRSDGWMDDKHCIVDQGRGEQSGIYCLAPCGILRGAKHFRIATRRPYFNPSLSFERERSP